LHYKKQQNFLKFCPSGSLYHNIFRKLSNPTDNMGCNTSRQVAASASTASFQFVDDSLHVMIEHSKKVSLQHGETPQGYIPRPQHPILCADAAVDDDLTVEESTLTAAESADSSAVQHSGISSQ